jgi:hypothetical protein
LIGTRSFCVIRAHPLAQQEQKGGKELMQTLAHVKLLLLDVLESAFQAGDVCATQQLGVNMSNAVKRDGVVIIQNQNVEVYARIMPLMVKALKACDALESPESHPPTVTIEPEHRQLPPPADDVDPDR